MSQALLQHEQLLRRRPDGSSGSRSVTLFKRHQPRFHAPAFQELFYSLEARRTGIMPLVVQFISPSPRAGVSTVSSGYARVAADATQQPVLFVDAAISTSRGNVDTLVGAFSNTGLLDSAIMPARNADNLMWARLCDSSDNLLSMGMERLRLLLDLLRRQYPLVVLDSSCVSYPGSTAISRFCDGTVLVVRAGATGQTEINLARRKVEQLGGQLIGLVLNREPNRPSLPARQFG